MSIFRNTFHPKIANQLNTRQNAINGISGARSTKEIQYLNSRNAWIRMCSSVNVNGTSDLAKNNVLLGGALKYEKVNGQDTYSLRPGIGKTGKEAYSTRTATNSDPYRLGIRPMPGITNMNIKSKSAYGSLREATVNFICWDIKQLEELELLYMRPGYTVLVEWGWLPYITLDKSGNQQLVTSVPNGFYDILNKGATDRTAIFKELYDKSLNSEGNYDAMFGYVKNYQWSARPDGGYDCQTTIISTGEIIESLKVNYVLPNLTRLNSSNLNGDAFLNDEFSNQGKFNSSKWKSSYEKNILAGIWAEAYDKLSLKYGAELSSGSIFENKVINLDISGLKSPNTNNTSDSLVSGITQLYITLEAVFDTINKYVMPEDTLGNSLIKLSTYTENYSSAPEPLLCVAHPVQVSVDPSVCLINSPLWYNSVTESLLYTATQVVDQQLVDQIVVEITSAQDLAPKDILKAIKEFEVAVLKIKDIFTYTSVDEKLKSSGNSGFKSIDEILSDSRKGTNRIGIGGAKDTNYSKIISHLQNIIGTSYITVTYKQITQNSKDLDKITINYEAASQAEQKVVQAIVGAQQAIANLQFLKYLPRPFFRGDQNGYDELGIIGNIFVNLDFLYKQALDSNLESSDNNGQNQISLFKYIKSIMSAIQTSIGNLNSFEIHVDPVDNNVARVIDVNYTGAKEIKNLFKLQVHNTKSVVRSYSLQSQIFPEQSSIIAIGSQAKGGQLGIQNNTVIDFNKNITDRITPEKLFPNNNALKVDDITKSTSVASNLGGIINLFSSLDKSEIDLNTLYNGAKNNLRDLIIYFQSITNSPGASRNIIPIKFSFDMDGIGGLVIGHLFEINDDILPKGYKGVGIGSKLAQTVTGIGHTIGNGDWVTTIDALNIILDSKVGGIPFQELKLQEILLQSLKYSLSLTVAPNCTSLLQPRPFTTYLLSPSPTNKDDIKFYEEVLTGIGAPITPENLYFLYAWRNGESGEAAWNPFNTTQPATGATCYNSVRVRNYPDRATGLKATIDTLLNGRYSGIVRSLKSKVNAFDIATTYACSELTTWGTGHLVNNVLSSGWTTVKPIAQKTTKTVPC